MDAVLSAAAALSKKRRLDPTLEKLDGLIEVLEDWRARHDGAAEDVCTPEDLSTLRESLNKLDARGTVQGYHRELLAATSKLGKAADKVIGANLDGAVPTACTLDRSLVNEAIYDHLLIGGRFEVATCFARELHNSLR